MASYFEIEQEGKISEIYEFEFYSPSGETDVTINANSSSGEDSTISNVKSLKNGSYIGYDREIGCSWVIFKQVHYIGKRIQMEHLELVLLH